METGGTVDGGRCTGNAFQLSNLGAFAQSVHDVLGGQFGTQYVVGCDLAVDFHAINGTVHRDDANALGHSSLHGTGNGIGVNGVDDQNADALGNQVFHIGDLLGDVVTGINNGDLSAQLGGGSFSAFGQRDEEGVVQGGDRQADGAIAHGLDRFGNICVGFHVLDVDQGHFNGNCGGDGLAGNQLGSILNSGLTDQSGLLCDGGIHTACLDGLDGIVGGVEAHHNDVLAGTGDGFNSTQCHFVVGGKDALDVAVGLEHIFHDGHALGTVEVSGLLCNNFQLGIGNAVEALAAVDGSGSTGNAFQLGNLGTFAQGVYDVLGGQLGTQDVVGCNLAVDFHAVNGTVHGDDLNTLCLGSFHSAGDGIGVNGVDDQDADALGNQVFHIGNLLGDVIAGVNNGQCQAQVGSSFFSALYQSDEEGVILGGNGEADGAGGSGLAGGQVFFTVNDNAAGGEGQCHGQTQQQRNQFFQIFHCKFSLPLNAFCRTEQQPE